MAPQLRLLLALALRVALAEASEYDPIKTDLCCFKEPMEGYYQAGHHDISVSMVGGHPIVESLEDCRKLCCEWSCQSLDIVQVQEKFRCYLSSVTATEGAPGAMLKQGLGATYQELTSCTTIPSTTKTETSTTTMTGTSTTKTTTSSTTLTVTTTTSSTSSSTSTTLGDPLNPLTQPLQLLEPVYDFWNAYDKDHTTHIMPAWEGEEQGHVQFYAFRDEQMGSEPVKDFWNPESKEHTQHMDPPGKGEFKKKEPAGGPEALHFYAFRRQVPGTMPVSNFWHTVNKEFTHHMGGPWGGEEQKEVLFYAYPEPVECSFRCVVNCGCELPPDGMRTDWVYYWSDVLENRADAMEPNKVNVSLDECKNACAQTPGCYGLDWRKADHCALRLSDTCNVEAGCDELKKRTVSCSKWCNPFGAETSTTTTTSTQTETNTSTTTSTSTVSTTTSSTSTTSTEVLCTAGYYAVNNTICKECRNGATRRRRAESCTRCPAQTYDPGDSDECVATTTFTTTSTATTTTTSAPEHCKGYHCPAGWAPKASGHKCYNIEECTFIECCEPRAPGDAGDEMPEEWSDFQEPTTTTGFLGAAKSTTMYWAGEQSTVTTTTTWTDCPPGHFMVGEMLCHRCTPGSTRRRVRSEPGWCTECPPGKYDAGDFDDCFDGTTTVQALPSTPPVGSDWQAALDAPEMVACESFTWELIAHQHLMGDNSGFFGEDAAASMVQNEDKPEANAYMIIGKVNASDESLRPNGRYHFKLAYDGDTTVEWAQSSWLAEEAIRGFECISPQDCGPSTLMAGEQFHGLARSSAKEWSIFDGDGSEHWQWFNSVGARQEFEGGIPGWNGKIYNTMSLMMGHCEKTAVLTDSKASVGRVDTGGVMADIQLAATGALALAALAGISAAASVCRRKDSIGAAWSALWRPGRIARAPPQRGYAGYAAPDEQPEGATFARREMQEQLVE